MSHLTVTTSEGCSFDRAREAELAASEIGVRYVRRGKGLTLESLLDQSDSLVVFEQRGVVLHDRQGALRFAAGLAELRIRQLEAGERFGPLSPADRLLKVSGVTEGDAVLDCTLGLAADAQVAARAVGPRGRVVGLESSPALYLLARHGLAALPPRPGACAIEVLHMDAHRHLARLPDRAFDVVLFDPMFERPRKASAAFEMLRRHADHAPLTPEALAEARRVARKAVVVKGSPHSSDFKKLGLRAEPGRSAARVLWAKLEPNAPGR